MELNTRDNGISEKQLEKEYLLTLKEKSTTAIGLTTRLMVMVATSILMEPCMKETGIKIYRMAPARRNGLTVPYS